MAIEKRLRRENSRRRYVIVSCSVSCGSRGGNPSSSSAFDESKYQKYSACSTSFGATGDALPQFLNTDSIIDRTRHREFLRHLEHRRRDAASRSSRPKNCGKRHVRRTEQDTFPDACPFSTACDECRRRVACIDKIQARRSACTGSFGRENRAPVFVELSRSSSGPSSSDGFMITSLLSVAVEILECRSLLVILRRVICPTRNHIDRLRKRLVEDLLVLADGDRPARRREHHRLTPASFAASHRIRVPSTWILFIAAASSLSRETLPAR